MPISKPAAVCQLPSYVVREGDAWVGHCVPLGLASQGGSLLEAINLLEEAAHATIANLLKRGLDPLRARQSCRATLEEFLSLQAQVQVEVDLEQLPENANAVLFDLLVSFPHPSSAAEPIKLAKAYGHVSVPLSMAC